MKLFKKTCILGFMFFLLGSVFQGIHAGDIPSHVYEKARNLLETIENPRHRELLQNFLKNKIEFSIDNPLISELVKQYPAHDIPDIPLNQLDFFEVKTSLIVPTPLNFINGEIKNYAKFFADHIRGFIPFNMLSNSYDRDNNIMNVLVELPQALKKPGFSELNLNYTIKSEENSYSFILNISGVISVYLKDSVIKITVEDLQNSQFCIAHFHAITHYTGDDPEEVEQSKISTLVIPLANKLKVDMEPLTLGIQKALYQKYEAIESNNLVELARLLEQDIIDYGKTVSNSEETIFNKRGELSQRILDFRKKVCHLTSSEKNLSLPDLFEILSSYNRLIIRALEQSALSRSVIEAFGAMFTIPYTSENYPLLKDASFDNKDLLTEIFILDYYADNDSVPIFAHIAAAILNFYEYTDALTQSYALKISYKCQLGLLHELAELGFNSGHSIFQLVGFVNNPYSASVFHHLLQHKKTPTQFTSSFNRINEVKIQPFFIITFFPDLEFFELATHVKSPFQKKAFKALLYTYPDPIRGSVTYKGEIAREILSIDNDHALLVFRELLARSVEENIYYVYAARIQDAWQASLFLQCYFNNGDRDPDIFKRIIE